MNANETSNEEPVTERVTLFDSSASKARQAHAVSLLIRCAKSGICCAMVKIGQDVDMFREVVDTSVDRCGGHISHYVSNEAMNCVQHHCLTVNGSRHQCA